MAHQSQCPSTKGKRSPAPARELARVGGTGQKLWRSLDEVADTPAFREFVEREFPAGASELLTSSRRDFMRLMGAGLALAGAATIPGCRRPDHKIMAYSKEVPEEAIPGKPIFYATSMPIPGGGAEGLVVETHEYRPTKIEGNPLHPVNQGKSSIWAQASVLGLYDPDRLKHPTYRESPDADGEVATWDDFRYWWEQKEHLFERFDGTGGQGLAILVNRKSSPSRAIVRDALKKRFPNAIFAVHEPAAPDEAMRGSREIFGRPMRERLRLSQARTIVSIDRDFLNTATMGEPDALVNAREFAASRRVLHAGDPMSRLYVAESGFSLAGGQADHRVALSPSRLSAFAVLLARRVLERLDDAPELAQALARVDANAGDDIDEKMLDVIADELVEHRGKGVVLVGHTQPAPIHALAHALNRVLGNVGRTVGYYPIDDPDEQSLSTEGVRAVASAIESGAIDTLICIECNPVYDAPGELAFGDLFRRVQNTITLDHRLTETAAASRWSLNGTHFLESWGDTRAIDGTIAPIQPMIAPLYEPAMSEIEFLAWLSGDARFTDATDDTGQPRYDGRKIVREAWKALGLSAGASDDAFRRALHDGIVAGTGGQWSDGGVPRQQVFQRAAASLARLTLDSPGADGFEVVIDTGMVADGRFCNDAWLHELPQIGTRVAWDNPLLISPQAAERLGVLPDPYIEKEPKARVVSLTHQGRTIEVPVWILPGMADNTAILTLGYGRTKVGVVGEGVGFDANPIRGADGARVLAGARIAKAGRDYFIASTQNHWSLEGRTAIVRQLDKKWFDKYADDPVEVAPDEIYSQFEKKLNLAEKLGELTHTPPNISAYPNPFNESPADPAPGSRYSRRPQWGMSIDMTTCTGCGVCTIACQSENNIPVVGKKETAKGREMHWIRVDRYFTGEDPFHPEEMVHQPVPCVQCENAPCETVCPVNATSHGPEGLNHMAYNRCIGTRYCANNCPYKVRRFNWMDYGQVKFNGGYVGQKTMSALGIAPENQNLIPPRLRKRIDEIARMKKNPDVTIRGRGVMEKCTYCVQRINAARYETKLRDLEHIPDGFFQTACQQACPSDAIVFGDLLDTESKARKMRDNPRSYLLLGYLNTRPRTTHMLRVRNPHPDLISPERRDSDPLAHGGGHHDDHSSEHAPVEHDNGHGEPHAEPAGHGEGGGHSFLHIPGRRSEDEGYALSLRVLASSSGVTA